MADTKSDATTGPTVLPVRDGEEPWTPEEIAEIRADLLEEIERMEQTIAASEQELSGLLREGSDGAGRDPADVGSSNFERDQELSLAHNSRALLEQAQLALRLFDNGDYGRCEVCGQPIGKGRLQAFPRATMCVQCKQREERR